MRPHITGQQSGPPFTAYLQEKFHRRSTMPVRIIVNRTRKLSKDYNSESYGLSLDTEYNGDVSANPQEFADRVHQLFDLIESLLEEKVKQSRDGTSAPTRTSSRSTANGNTRRSYSRREPNGNGGGRNGNGDGPRSLTYAQEKAIKNMARKLQVDADEWARQDHNLAVRELTVKQASQLIDALKHEIEAGEPQEAQA
jgi:hypothetical protein